MSWFKAPRFGGDLSSILKVTIYLFKKNVSIKGFVHTNFLLIDGSFTILIVDKLLKIIKTQNLY